MKMEPGSKRETEASINSEEYYNRCCISIKVETVIEEVKSEDLTVATEPETFVSEFHTATESTSNTFPVWNEEAAIINQHMANWHTELRNNTGFIDITPVQNDIHTNQTQEFVFRRTEAPSLDTSQTMTTNTGKSSTQLSTSSTSRTMYPEEGRYGCSVCHSKFACVKKLLAHKVATNQPNVCKLCCKAFASPQDVVKHSKKQHRREKTHLCSICGKGFCTTRHLIIHTRNHTGERPYVCNICKKGFTSSGALTSHIAIHTDPQEHVCSICNKVISKAGNLKRHHMKHVRDAERKKADVRVCNICNQEFPNFQKFKSHICRINVISKGKKNKKDKVVSAAQRLSTLVHTNGRKTGMQETQK